jgi:transcriptional regulator with PAS, ATPase and Fis domain
MAGIITRDAEMQKVCRTIERVATTDVTILLLGESGTGKEILARALHSLSPRRGQRFIAINCAAIPENLLESELFGYEKGAFTGAVRQTLGKIETAHRGTLFLDEIGDLDLSLQSKLLRVLQEREFSPVGSDQVRSVDVRFLAASNRDLKELARQGKFREDLLYRLDVYSIMVPPLRARRDDIALLAHAFLRELASETEKLVTAITPAALDLLERYAWPGNVRELRNTIERALLSCRGGQIDVGDLPPTVRASSIRAPEAGANLVRTGDGNLDAWLDEIERRAILDALAECKGVQVQAARRLGISERSLWHRIKKLNIQISRTAG